MKRLYFNREISWLRFNERVLAETERLSTPLLERVKFLAISASNLDEFFMVRVGALQTLLKAGRRVRDLAEMTPFEQLRAVRKQVLDMYQRQYHVWDSVLEPALAEVGICRHSMKTLATDDLVQLRRYFEEQIFPLLTPVAIDCEADETVYRIPGRKLCLLFRVGADEGEGRSVVISLPGGLPRMVRVDSKEGFHYVLLEDMVAFFADEFFPMEKVMAFACFRITRDGDIPVREDYAPDLAAAMEEVLTARKSSDTVRLEYSRGTPQALVGEMGKIVNVATDGLYRLSSMLDLSGLMELLEVPGFEELRDVPWKPQPCSALQRGESIFDLLHEGDMLLHHPYESFDPVVRLIEEAAEDKNVVAIKQVLYRTASNSRIISALIRAAENGKQVTVFVELKARFDEARNVERAEELRLAGAHLVYGIKGLKTHAKTCLIVRRESGRIRRYAHFGTGNYNESTAKLYTDISYLTSRPDYVNDAAVFFNGITGRSQMLGLQKLIYAPVQMKKTLVRLIQAETSRAQMGETAKILAKMNSLQDREVIDALYEASAAGVTVRLMIRGICCLRAGVKGLSESIEVYSVVDRYLEHARLSYFHNGGDPLVFFSSADWMERNLDKRIELMVPLVDSRARAKAVRILKRQFEDTTHSWKLLEDGSYERVVPKGKRKLFRLQEHFMGEARRVAQKEAQENAGVFELHLPPKGS